MTREQKIAWVVALGVHVVLIGGAMFVEGKPPPVEPVNIHVAKTVQFDVELPKPEPLPEEPPVAETPRPTEVAKAEPAPQPVARPKPRSNKPKQETAQAEAPSPAEPAPLVLSQVYEGGGGVAVERGDEDVLGDPAVEANERNRRNPTDAPVRPAAVEAPAPAPAVVRPEDVISRAVPREACPVEWPQDAPVERRIVEVRLLLTVDRTGKVTTAKVLRGAGESFDRAAREALERCAFEPGRRNGQPMVDRVPFVVEFKPRDA